MFGNASPTPYDLNFRLFGISVRIHPLFWVIAVLFSPLMREGVSDMRIWLLGMTAWVSAWFLVFIIHELGHALVLKWRYGASPWIVLYGFGGAAIHHPYYRRAPGWAWRILISFAGPAAELAAVAILLGGCWLGGFRLVLTVNTFGPIPIPLVFPEDLAKWIMERNLFLGYFSYMFLLGFIWMGMFWAFVNLLPIYPLDGGHLVRHFLMQFDPRTGLASSLFLSMLSAGGIAFYSIRENNFFIGIFFAFFAIQNFQEWQNSSRTG